MVGSWTRKGEEESASTPPGCVRFLASTQEMIIRRQPHQYTSVYVRRIVIYQTAVLQKTSSEIATDLDLGLHTVQRLRRRWRLLGTIIREPHREGPRKVLDDMAIQVSAH